MRELKELHGSDDDMGHRVDAMNGGDCFSQGFQRSDLNTGEYSGTMSKSQRGLLGNLLGFKLVRQDQVCKWDDLLISGDYIVVHVQTTLVTHDRVQD